jgi:5-methyltetrahydrofolate--homocysteine methyltransferase
MTKVEFRELIQSRIIILDGSTGVALQKRDMPAGVCPEQWCIENPDHLIGLQKEYAGAGSEILYTFTFGGNPVKLSEFGINGRTFEINKKLAEITRQAAGKNVMVAGDIAPTGHFPRPFGETPFEDFVNLYKEQVRGLLAGGVDLFAIETMMDIQEARAAVLAVKELCDLPVMISMTFDKDRRTLTGTDPVTALITLQSLGVDAFGINCSAGPAEMVEVIKLIKPYALIPVFAKPNAGLPRLVNGETVFDMNAGQFCGYAAPFAEAGVNLLGGCCGTSPEFIRQTAEALKGKAPVSLEQPGYSAVTSARKTVFAGPDRPLVIIGERINPTGKKDLQAELKEGKTSVIRKFAQEQAEAGAEILDINVGMPGINEKDVMIKTVELLSSLSELPLCLDSSSADVIESALRAYPGRALINSISGEKSKLEKLLPVAAKYGAMFILLPLDDNGIPETSSGRMQVVEKVIAEASKFGYSTKDIIVDGLVMTVSSDQYASGTTLELIQKASELGCNTTMGLSNVSFGLPERGWVNSSFLSMAAAKGLTTAIANPSVELIMNTKYASDVLLVRDKNSGSFIQRFAGGKKTAGVSAPAAINIEDGIFNAVIKGNTDTITGLIEQALKSGKKPSWIVDSIMIPAINKVGDLFDKKEYFLPQLIQSAEAMKKGFLILEPLLKAEGPNSGKKENIVVMATVKGDIHDIGKNIVSLMLRNYGFLVFDLGKDVPAETIVRKAKETGANIIGLSALMTTTMIEMKPVIDLARREGLKARVMIGGAVVNQAYADEIGADGYSKDAYEAVKLAQKFCS